MGALFDEAVKGFGFEGFELGGLTEGGAEGGDEVDADGVGAGGADEGGGGACFFPGEVVSSVGFVGGGEGFRLLEKLKPKGGELGGGHEAAAGVVEGAESAEVPVGGAHAVFFAALGLFPPDVPALTDEVAGGFGIALGERWGEEAGGADEEGVAFDEGGVFEVGDGEALGELTEGGAVFFVSEGGEEFAPEELFGGDGL